MILKLVAVREEHAPIAAKLEEVLTRFFGQHPDFAAAIELHDAHLAFELLIAPGVPQ